MSIIFLHGGGLSQEQLDRVPLRGGQFRYFMARWFAAIRAGRQTGMDKTDNS